MKELQLGKEEGALIQLMHANAYTPGCYRQVCSHIEDYKIVLPEQRPLWSDSDPKQMNSWQILANDLIDHMDHLNRKNVIGMGHSMGGIASWLAAIKRPDLFSRLVLIDPVILPKWGTRIIRWLPSNIKIKYFPPIKIASRRKDRWESMATAKEYFLSKKFFQRFDPAAMEDFLNYGLQERDGYVQLVYPRKWEARVYATPPNVWKVMGKSPCPITIIRATYSDVISDKRWNAIQKKVKNGHFIEIENAGHLVPFEQPELCAEIINDILKVDN